MGLKLITPRSKSCMLYLLTEPIRRPITAISETRKPSSRVIHVAVAGLASERRQSGFRARTGNHDTI